MTLIHPNGISVWAPILRVMQYLVNVIQIHISGIDKTVTETKKEIL